jgi:hypothetical protein
MKNHAAQTSWRLMILVAAMWAGAGPPALAQTNPIRTENAKAGTTAFTGWAITAAPAHA